jgi:hypothetical protein
VSLTCVGAGGGLLGCWDTATPRSNSPPEPLPLSLLAHGAMVCPPVRHGSQSAVVISAPAHPLHRGMWPKPRKKQNEAQKWGGFVCLCLLVFFFRAAASSRSTP